MLRKKSRRPDPDTRHLREFYELGQRISNEAGDKKGYQTGLLAEFEDEGHSRSRLEKARQFARVYTQEQFDGLCRLRQKQSKRPLGIGHVYQLIGIKPVSKRTRLQNLAARNDWSVRDLQKEKAKLLGKQNRGTQGGRKPKPPTSEKDAIQKIRDMADQWTRWCKMMRSEDVAHVTLDDLPTSIAAAIGRVERSIKKLTKEVGNE